MAKMKKEPTVRYVAAGIAAETLGVSTDSLRRWAKAGKIDFMRTPGGRYRFNLDGFMASQGKVRAPAVVEPVKAPTAKKASTKAPSPKPGIMPVTPVVPVLKPATPVQMDLIEAVSAAAPVPPPVSAADLVAALMAAPKSAPVLRDAPVYMPTLGESARRRPVIEGLEHRDME